VTLEASAPPKEVPARDPGPIAPSPGGGRDPSSLDGDYRPTAWLFLRAFYVMHDRPGPTDRRPPIVAPHQPRVDFQMWFFTLGRDGGQHEYFNTLVQRLCARSPSAESLFLADSRPHEAPAIIRVAYDQYRMTDRATLARSGQYWTRELVAYHPAAHFCDAPSPPRF
jgi:hypothetical protein